MAGVVGREPELKAVDACLDGTTRALAIVGEPGIGKTTVWREAVERARARGATVLAARPAESEVRLSFGGVADLTSTVLPEAFDALPAPQRRGLDVALLRADSTGPPARRVVATALLTLVRGLAAESAVVIAIDDLHWLDPPSSVALEFMLRRLEDENVRMIFSLRPDATALPGLETERIEIGSLSVAALHRILGDALGRTFARPILIRIADASGGNPLHALEIARELERRGVQDSVAPLPVPDSLGALVRARVRALPAPTRDALLRVAALARPDIALVEQTSLAAAEEAGLVSIDPSGRVRFTHPLFASAVYAAAATTRRRAVHADLAAVVVDPIERAHHLALASNAPDPEVVAELESAAQIARSRAAPDTAASLLDLALRLVPPASEESQRLRLELAEHLYFASDFARSRTVLEELLDALAPGDLRSRALAALAEIDYWHKGESTAAGLMEEALECADSVLQRARCLTQFAMYAGTVDLERARSAASAACELLEGHEAEEPALAASALGARVRAELFLGYGYDAAAAGRAQALELAAPSLPVAVDGRVVFKLGQWLRYIDDLDGARTRLDEAEQQAREEGDDASLGNILLNQVVVETWAGNWDDATALTQRMSDAFDQQGVAPEGIGPWRAYVHAYAGRLDETLAAAGPPPSEPLIAAIHDRCVGLAQLAAGDVAAADRHLARAVEVFERVDFREPAIWRVDGDAIEAAVALGELERAERLVARVEEQAERTGIPWSRVTAARGRGLLLAAAGELEQAAASLERALAEQMSCPMPYERARTLLVQGQVLRRLKRKREARIALDEAAEAFARLGADAWVARATAERQRVASRQAPEGLTPSELRVARLAADGLTNPEIAAQVFVSRKTVEATLARVYRKLSISSRGQLDRALRETEHIT
ncbi:MAG TPA: AAA family ATPase [Gaiellaceae bacterium]|jgi:DNA-binding CsgD family transcriptional regulator